MKLNRDLVYWYHFMIVLLFGGLVLGYPSLKIVLLNENIWSEYDEKVREVMYANINAYGSTGMAFRVFYAAFIDVIGARWSVTIMMISEIIAYALLGSTSEPMFVNAAYFLIGAAGGAVLIGSQYTANLFENFKFMTANFNVAFAMSGIVFYLMLVGTWYGMSRSLFCYIFCGVIALFCVLNHMFYYHNIVVTTAEVDEDGCVNPDREKEKVQKESDFKWSEVWEIISSHELLMLALFYSMNSVCIVWTISTLNKQLALVGSNAPQNFSVVYTVASLNVFLFAMVLQKFGFTVGYIYIIVFGVLGHLTMHYPGEYLHYLGFVFQNMCRNPTYAFTFTYCNTFFPRKYYATIAGSIIFFSSFLNFCVPEMVRFSEERGDYKFVNWCWIIARIVTLPIYCYYIYWYRESGGDQKLYNVDSKADSQPEKTNQINGDSKNSASTVV
eukprot:Mrub_02598.p1 GENE.Mrub_02598~~Mrub_02598.p1  ORF type:complete len:442 (+),score=152.90 Mrub_02598:285-1610(+)